MAGFCVVPKEEVVVFWGVPKTDVGGFAGVLPNTDVVVFAGVPKTDRDGLVAPVPPKTLVG